MKKLLTLILLTIPIIGMSQSYVFCPEIKTEQRQGFNDIKISVVFKDSREYDKRVIEKCTKEDIFNSFTNFISQTFPSFDLAVLSEDKFQEDAAEGEVRLKIDILKCDATFYPGVYVSNTSYFVTMIDNRSGLKIYRDSIKGAGNQFNLLGMKSGKIALNSSFQRAFDQFVLMFDKLLPNYVESYTSEQAIAELKKYKEKLDLQIISQEEYDKKKLELMKFIQ
ncbi:MAG: hypothetical protein Q8S23_07825 [Bacteroidales bacterium]|nr:hypothetical protein [Bacteroidales bacterium]